jgi:hypothetical protein
MEYMAYALPSVAFDLVETRVSGDDTVLYVPSGEVAAFADAVEQLLDNPELRIDMAKRARSRVSSQLDWRPQSMAYVSVFDGLQGRDPDEFSESADPSDAAAYDSRGRCYVCLDDELEFERFIRERTAP